MEDGTNHKKKMLPLAAIIGIAALLALLLWNNKTGDINVEMPGVKLLIKEREIPDYRDKVKERLEDYEEDVSTMDKLIAERRIAKDLRDSIDQLILVRKREINEGRYLMERFSDFKKMNARQREEFLREVVSYLGYGQARQPDLGLRAADLARQREIEELKTENQMLKGQVASLTAEIESLSGTIQNLRNEAARMSAQSGLSAKDQERLGGLYAEALDKISRLEDELDAPGDASALAEVKIMLEEIELQNQSLLDSLAGYRGQLASVRNVRIDNPFWEPASARKKKKAGAYLLKDSKEINLEFKLNYNYPTDKQKERLKFVFFIAQSDSEYKQVTWEREITLGAATKLVIREGELADQNGRLIEFKEGIYTVQIFHLPTSEDKPILIRNFKAVKALF